MNSESTKTQQHTNRDMRCVVRAPESAPRPEAFMELFRVAVDREVIEWLPVLRC